MDVAELWLGGEATMPTDYETNSDFLPIAAPGELERPGVRRLADPSDGDEYVSW
jgi:hypothetical protein